MKYIALAKWVESGARGDSPYFFPPSYLLSWMASVGLPETDDRLGDGGEWRENQVSENSDPE